MWILILILSIPAIWIIYGVIKGSAVERGLIKDIKDIKPLPKKAIENEKGELKIVEKTGSEKIKDWFGVILVVIVGVLIVLAIYFFSSI